MPSIMVSLSSFKYVFILKRRCVLWEWKLYANFSHKHETSKRCLALDLLSFNPPRISIPGS